MKVLIDSIDEASSKVKFSGGSFNTIVEEVEEVVVIMNSVKDKTSELIETGRELKGLGSGLMESTRTPRPRRRFERSRGRAGVGLGFKPSP